MKVFVPDKEHGWLAATLLSLDTEAAEVLVSLNVLWHIAPILLMVHERCLYARVRALLSLLLAPKYTGHTGQLRSSTEPIMNVLRGSHL